MHEGVGKFGPLRRLTLEGHGSQQTAIYTIYTCFTKFKSPTPYVYVFDTLVDYTLPYVKEKIKIYLYQTLMIKMQHMYLKSGLR